MEFDVMFPSWLGAVMKEMENSVWNGRKVGSGCLTFLQVEVEVTYQKVS